ncbi:MAG: hypothetical protein JWN70_5393 [Planctomycetaceae bacterium]|nr:hypothetical protein [Planctomycetaceae bacterium]
MQIAWRHPLPFIVTMLAALTLLATPSVRAQSESEDVRSEPVTGQSDAATQTTVSESPTSPAAGRLPTGDTQLGPGQQAVSGSTSKGSAGVPGYKLLRFDEDYSYLRELDSVTEPLDHLKYIPFGAQDGYFLTLGGDVREWFESYHNDSFGAGPGNAEGYNTYFLQRYMLHADIHLGSDWRIFVQSISGFEDGRIGGPRPDIDVNRFDAHQGFVDWKWSADNENNFTWRIGRQELRYGSGRLIDVREGPNLRRSFDALRALTNWGDWSIDGWWGKPVRNNPAVFDDDPNPTVSFWGVYGVRPVGDGTVANVDLYYLGLKNQAAEFNQQQGHEARHTVGTRLWGRPMPWEYNLEYIYQFGGFGTGRINAWSAANAVRYNFETLTWKPSTGIRFDVASGDQNANSANLQTFNPLFPSGAYFNLAGPFGPLNMIDLHPTLDLHLNDNVTVSADWNFFWRESVHDGVYRLSGALLASDQNSQARYIGSSPAMTLIWTPQRHVTVLVSYVHVFPGSFIKDATPGQPIDFVTAWFTYKF